MNNHEPPSAVPHNALTKRPRGKAGTWAGPAAHDLWSESCHINLGDEQ